jgi:hypothetical protein
LIKLSPEGLVEGVTDEHGQPIHMPVPNAESAGNITPKVTLEALTEQLKAAQGATVPNPDTIASLQSQIVNLLTSSKDVAASPAGMKFVGYAGGKAIYEDAKGKRFSGSQSQGQG